MLTDASLDPFGEQSLILREENRDAALLGKLRSSLAFFASSRGDLHPRWNRDGSAICVDSTHHGKREMLVVYLSTID